MTPCKKQTASHPSPSKHGGLKRSRAATTDESPQQQARRGNPSPNSRQQTAKRTRHQSPHRSGIQRTSTSQAVDRHPESGEGDDMPPKKRGQKTHQYRPFPEICRDISAGYEPVNQQWAQDVQPQYAEGNVEHETEARMIDRKEWVWGSLVTYLMNNVDVYPQLQEREFVTTSQVIAKRLITVFMSYNSPYCVRALNYYNGGITSEVRGWAVERSNKNMDPEIRRQPFDHSLFDKHLSCSVLDDQVWATLNERMHTDGTVKRGT